MMMRLSLRCSTQVGADARTARPRRRPRSMIGHVRVASRARSSPNASNTMSTMPTTAR